MPLLAAARHGQAVFCARDGKRRLLFAKFFPHRPVGGNVPMAAVNWALAFHSPAMSSVTSRDQLGGVELKQAGPVLIAGRAATGNSSAVARLMTVLIQYLASSLLMCRRIHSVTGLTTRPEECQAGG